MKRVLFHVRASPDYGWGHLMRAARLAGACREWAECRFVLEGTAAAEDHLVQLGGNLLHRLDDTPVDEGGNLDRALAAWRPDTAVIDMLRPNLPAIGKYRNSGARILVMSDEGVRCAQADMVICPNPRELWADDGDAQLIGGLEYVLIPEELAELRGQVGLTPGSRIVVNTGGVTTRPTFDRTIAVLRQLDAAGFGGKYVVGMSPDFDPASVVHNLANFEVIAGQQPLCSLVEGVDVAFVTAGYIRYELAYLGFPMALTSIADHQAVFGQWFARHGAADYVGPLTGTAEEILASRIADFVMSRERRRLARAKAMMMVDGGGAKRLAGKIRKLSAR